jgi:hypothetical protein
VVEVGIGRIGISVFQRRLLRSFGLIGIGILGSVFVIAIALGTRIAIDSEHQR